MIIERTKSEIVIRMSSKVDTYGLQRLLDYLRYQKLTASSQAKQSDVDALAKEVNKNWWDNNKHRFITE
jgi:DeoR/GlpR family transcriptional regulator of sugar metabolism